MCRAFNDAWYRGCRWVRHRPSSEQDDRCETPWQGVPIPDGQKAGRGHPFLLALPLVLHVCEVRNADEEAACQCIGNFHNVKFRVSPRVISHRPPCIEYFRTCPIRQLMIETDSPSLFFDHSLNPSPPTTPQSTYEVACWLACLQEEPLQYVLESVRKNFDEFYGFQFPSCQVMFCPMC